MSDCKKLFDSVLQHLSTVRDEQAKRRKDKTLVPWVDEIIVSFVDAIECLRACERFYRGKERREPQKLLSRCLENPSGLLETIRLQLVSLASVQKQFPSAEQVELLQMGHLAFESLLVNATDISFGREMPFADQSLFAELTGCSEQADAAARGRLAQAAYDYVWCVAETAYRLTLLEQKIWHDHAKWEVPEAPRPGEGLFDGWEWQPEGPQERRERFERRYQALQAFDEANPDVFLTLHRVRRFVREPTESRPVLFVRQGFDERLHSYSDDLRKVLVLDPCVRYVESSGFGKSCIGSYEPSRYLTIARAEILNDLDEYFRLRATHAPANSPVRRKWYEAAAELLANVTDVYDAAAADRIIALANDAQRESWIEAMVRGSEKDDDRRPAFVPLPPAAPPAAQPAPITAEQVLENLAALLDRRLGKPEAEAKRRTGLRRKDPIMGPGTTTMKQQLGRFVRYVEKCPIDENQKSTTVGARANQFWNKNREVLEAAAKRGGARKGYSCAKALAGAYRNSR